MTTPNARRLILNLLLAAQGEPLNVREAVIACALFDIRENSVRVALVRLASAGMVEAAGRGAYRLTPTAAGFATEIASWRDAEKRLRAWSGQYVTAHCGALDRSDRAALRRRDRALLLLGFRELETDLHVRPDNLEGGVGAVRARLSTLGLDERASVFLAGGFDGARDARARKLWDGRALSAGYRKTREQLERWLDHADELQPETAARESFLAGDRAIRQFVYDPLLPEPFVDAAARHAFVETLRRFDTAGRVLWRKLYRTIASSAPASASSASPPVH
jgi:phenylacetic acid degradation operon negative regulatory protein